MTHENTPSRPERHAPGPAMDGSAGRRPDRSRRAAPRTAVVLLAAVLGAALAAVPAFAWDDIYGNSFHIFGSGVESESLGYWNVEEGESVTVRFGKYNNLLMDSNMSFKASECKECTIEKAVAGTDFNTATGSVSFPGNHHPRVSSDFTIRTIENNKVDGKRCFYIRVDWSGKVNWTKYLNWMVKQSRSGHQTHVMCILDDDNTPVTQPQTVGVSVSNASVEEGGAMTFTVSAPVAAGGAFTVQPAFTHSTTESGDFTANTPELAFAGTGSETKTFTVQTTEDTAIEGTESFDVALTLVSKSFTGTIGLGKGRGTIRDDDYPELTISDASAVEGGSLRFTLTLDDAIPPGYSTFYVQPAITAGTATANSDYVAATPALVRFAGTKGETKTVSVTTLADTVRNEPDETLTLSASGVSSAPVITTDTGTGTIRERTYTDANKPALSVTGGGSVNEGSSVSWTVTLNKATSGPFTVTPDFTGTATKVSDYTVTAGSLLSYAGTANEAKTITIATLKDGKSESDETVLLGLTADRRDRVDDTATGSATIKNVDAPGGGGTGSKHYFAMTDVSVTEGGDAEITVSHWCEGTCSVKPKTDVSASVLGGTATSGSDYEASVEWKGGATTRRFHGGSTDKNNPEKGTLVVKTKDDSLVEGSETVEVGLSVTGVSTWNPPIDFSKWSNGVQAVVTINDDDTAGLSASFVTVNEGDTASMAVKGSGAVQGGYTLAPTLVIRGQYTKYTQAGRDYDDNPGSLTFAGTANETETLSVKTYADGEVTPDKRTCVSFRSDNAAVPTSGLNPCITIANTDQVILEVDDAQVAEDVKGGTVAVTVTSKKAVTGGFKAKISHDGTGTAGAADFTMPTTEQTWTGTAGESKTFTVTIANDTLSEGLETFGVQARLYATGKKDLVPDVPGASQDTAAKWNGTVSIKDDDNDWVSVSDPTVEEGGDLVFKVKLEKARSGGATLAAKVVKIPGEAGSSDYTDTTATLTFAGTKGEEKSFTVATVEDTEIEADETLAAVVSESGANKPVLTAGTGTITDDDEANVTVRVKKKTAGANAQGASAQGGLVTAAARAAVRERGWATAAEQAQATKQGKVYEGHDLVYEAVLDKAVPGGFTFTPNLGGGSATSGTDYGNKTGKLQFAGTADETLEFTVSAYKDATVEGDEDYGVAASVSATPHTVNVSKGFDSEILDADGADVTAQDVSAAEGDTLTFTVRLNKNVAGGLTVTPSYTNVKSCGTGASCKKAASGDYTANTTALTFTGTKGEEKSFTVATTENTAVDLDRTFQVSLNLSNYSGTVSGGSAIATITNDDAATVTVNDASASEGDAMTFTVTLDKAVENGLTVTPGYTNGTAASGDYTANTAALTFTGTANETETFTVSTTEDAVLEANETFTVGLTVSKAPALVTGTDTGTGTINNDDAAAVTVGDESASEGDSKTFAVTLDKAVQGGFTVTPSFTDVTAVNGTDYTPTTTPVTFTGTAGETQTLTIATTEDAVLEADETLTVGLTVSGTTLGVTATDTGTFTIDDDDDAAVTVNDKSADEGDSMTFTVTLSEAVQGGLTVTPGYANGTAADTDYTKNTSALSFTGTKGETQTFTVATTEDAVLEADETFTVDLTVSNAPTGATVTATDTGTATIDDDDSAAVTVDDKSASEGDSITFTVTLSEAVQGGLTVTPDFTDVTAVAGTDYTENTAALSFTGTKGETKTFTVATTEDAVLEADETFTVGLTVSGTTLTVTATDTGTGTITNDDSAAVTVNDASADEGDSMTFTVTLSEAVQGGLTVTPGYTNGTAESTSMSGPGDYGENTTALSFTGTKGETKTFTVSTTEDAVLEADETFTVGLTVSNAPTGATVTATDTGTGTIDDDDSAAVTVNDASADEGDSMTFTVTLSEAVQGGLTVTPGYANGTAESGDYTANTTALSFTGTKDETRTFTVATTEDAAVEEDETLTVGLTVSNAPSGVTATDTGTATIDNDDSAAVTLAAASADEGKKITFTATLSEAVEGGVTVTPSFTDKTATKSTDYTENTTALSFTGTKGETQTFDVSTTDDAVLEGDEAFTVALAASGAPAPASGGVTASGADGTIADDDGAQVKVNDAEADEGDVMTFTVTLSEAVQGGLTVTPSYTDVSAVEGTDYTENTTALSFTGTANETKTFTVSTTEDTVLEGNETFTVGLSVSGTTLGVGTADTGTGTVKDDDAAALTVDDQSASEGDSLTFTVTLDKAVQGGLTVTPSYTDVSTTKGTDYTANTTALSFTGTANETKTFTVSTTEDAVLEPDETFTVGLSVSGAPTGVTATDTGTGTIDDDDSAAVTVDDKSASEGVALTFTVTLSAAVQGGLTVTPDFTDVTAVKGTDYAENTAALSFTGTKGETQTFTVSTAGDAVLEPDETFTVGLTASNAPTGTTVTATDTGTGTITDDDSAAVTVDDAKADEGATITFTVTLSSAVQGGLEVTPSFTDVSAVEGTDYTKNTAALTFAGTANETKTFTVDTAADDVREPDETFTVDLTVSATTLTVTATDTATGTIVDDDRAAVTVDDVSSSEGDSMTFTVTLDKAVQGGLTVTPDFTDVSADEGTDYDENTTALSFTGTAGETKTFTVDTKEDAVLEGDETFTVGLTASNALVTDSDTATGTIEDDDDVTVTVDDASADEGETMTFTVTLDKAVQGGLTVTPSFTDVTAVEGTDYDENTTALSFTGTADETQTFTVSTTEDAMLEGDETFKVGLTVSGTPTGTTVTATDTGTGTITDDDSAALTMADASADEGETITFTVTLSAAVQGGLTVTPGFTDVTTDKSKDYTENTTALSFTGTKDETKTFTVATTEDTVVEGDETFTVALAVTKAPSGISGPSATGTVTDDDHATLKLAVDPASVAETAGATGVTVTAVTGGVTFEQDQTVTVTVGDTKDSATSDKDYAAVDAFDITITAGETNERGTFTLTPVDDNLMEGNEEISVAGTSTEMGADLIKVTLTDDDRSESKVPEILLSASPSLVVEGDAPETVTVTATVADGKAFALAQTVWVRVGAAGDSAQPGEDYARVSGFTITIAAEEPSGSASFTLSTIDDTVIEPEELITVAGTATDVEVHGTGVAIVDDDYTEITLTAAPALVPENAGATTVTVTASTDGNTFANDRTVTVSIGADGDAAVAGTDYETVSGFTITIAAGQTGASESFTLTPIDDRVIEGDEALTVAGSSPGLVVHDTSVTIVDDDYTEITLSAEPALVPEDAGATSVTVTASTDGDTFADDRTVTVSIGADGDSAVAGVDYQPVAGFTVTIAAGKTSGSSTFVLTPIDDQVIEGDEDLTVVGSSPGLVVHDTSVTIVDDDYTEITLTADPARVPEDAAPTTVTVTASTDGDTFADDRTVTVTIGADGDPAVAGTDYETVSGFTITIAAGRTNASETFILTPIDDTVVEGDETLTVAGSSPGLVVHDTSVTIVDDDHTDITLAADPASVPEEAGATTVTVTASTDGDTFADDRTVTVRIGATGDAAVAGSDYERVAGFTVTITAGHTSGSETFILTPIDDRVIEGDEPLTVAGISPGLVVHGTTVTIVDDDHTDITLTADPARVSEDADPTTVTVTASTDGDTFTGDRTVTVSIGADADPAVAGTDYEPVSGFTITIAAGKTSGSETFTLTPIDDHLMEGDEPITVAGSSPGLVVHATAVTLAEDDHTEIAMTVDPPQWNEGDGPTTVTVTLTLTSQTVRFPYAKTVAVSVHESGVEPAVDFAPVASFTITIPAGARSASHEFTLTPENDTLVEIAELITVVGQSAAAGEAASIRSAVTEVVELAVAALQEEINVLTTASAAAVAVDPAALVRESLAARAAAAGVLAAVVELSDDDAARVSLAADPEVVREDGGPRQVTVTATLQGAVFSMDRKVRVSLGAAGDGATTGRDYLAVDPFVITIAKGAGEGAATFTLTPVDDQELEEDETITVAGTLNGEPVRPAQVTLRDDDEPAARERFERLNETLLPELSRAWTESVLELARGCVAGPRAAADGGVQDLAGALHGSGEALNAGELSLAEALSGTALALPLATAEGADEAGGTDEAAEGAEPGRITAWAKGDYRQVAGDGGGQVRWDGQVFGAHAGVDARLDHGYTGGVGVAWSEGTAPYVDRGGAQPIAGDYRSRLASVHPYLCWNGADGSNAWGTVGGGAGLIEIDDEVAGRHQSDALAATVAAGGSLRLLTGPGLAAADATALNLRSDAWLTWHRVSGDGELISYHEVLTYRARLALTGTHVFALGGGGALSPEAELGVRWDGGAGATGLGLELGGGLGFAEPSWGLTAQLRGRALLVHERSELRDWGVSGLLRLGPGESGEGLSLTVQPAYGPAAGGGVERLWAQGAAAPETAAPLGAAAGASLSTEIGYGVAAAGSGVLTPYAGLDLTDAERSYRLGGRLAVATGLDLALEGLRRETAGSDPLHQLALTAAVTW